MLRKNVYFSWGYEKMELYCKALVWSYTILRLCGIKH